MTTHFWQTPNRKWFSLTKTCSKCKEEKSNIEFHNDRSKSDGFYSSCRQCTSKAAKIYRTAPHYKEEHNKRNRKYYKGTRSKQYRKDPVHYLFMVAKQRAKKNGLEFSITENDIKVYKICPILGTQLDVLTNKVNTSMSLDRIDNTKGYIPGNVAIISRRANLMKRDCSIEQLQKIISYMRGDV